jgi:hypothetical protein
MPEIIIPTRFLIERTLDSLYTGTLTGFDTPRKQTAGRVQVIKTEFIPAPRIRAVGVGANTRSAAKTYQTKIFFDDVVYLEDGDDQANAYTFTAPDGQDYMIEPITYNSNDAKVRCSCLDFHWRFAVWNGQDGSLLGDSPDPYIKKTDRAPNNPDEVPGLCKHLIALVDKLRQERFLK